MQYVSLEAFKGINSEGHSPNNVVAKTTRTKTETTTSRPDDVIYVTSPVYVPMTREDLEAETSTSGHVIADVTGHPKAEEQSPSNRRAHGETVEQPTGLDKQSTPFIPLKSILFNFC